MPSSSEDLKIKFIELLKDTTSNKVIQLYGRWGIGKTYLLNEVIKEIEPSLKKKVIKVSLFDKNSISELKEDILMQVYSYNKTLNRYANHMDTVQNVITKTFAEYQLSLVEKEEPKDDLVSQNNVDSLLNPLTAWTWENLEKAKKDGVVFVLRNGDKFKLTEVRND